MNLLRNMLSHSPGCARLRYQIGTTRLSANNFGEPARGTLMAQYAIAFDLDTKRMKADGVAIASVYNTEIPNALKAVGFTAHPQGSLYHTEAEQNPITAIMTLQSGLKKDAPQFCKYVRRVHVFRMEEWSDVTKLLAEREAPAEVTTDDDAGASEYAEAAG